MSFDQFPSDVGDQKPTDLTLHHSEQDGSIGKGKNIPLPLPTNFEPDKYTPPVEDIPPVVYYGTILDVTTDNPAVATVLIVTGERIEAWILSYLPDETINVNDPCVVVRHGNYYYCFAQRYLPNLIVNHYCIISFSYIDGRLVAQTKRSEAGVLIDEVIKIRLPENYVGLLYPDRYIEVLQFRDQDWANSNLYLINGLIMGVALSDSGNDAILPTSIIEFILLEELEPGGSANAHILILGEEQEALGSFKVYDDPEGYRASPEGACGKAWYNEGKYKILCIQTFSYICSCKLAESLNGSDSTAQISDVVAMDGGLVPENLEEVGNKYACAGPNIQDAIIIWDGSQYQIVVVKNTSQVLETTWRYNDTNKKIEYKRRTLYGNWSNEEGTWEEKDSTTNC